MSNSLDPDQAWHIVRHDLGPNPLQMFKRTPPEGKNDQYALKGEHVHKNRYQSRYFSANLIKIGRNSV